MATDRILAAFETVPVSRRPEIQLPSTLELHGPIAHEQLLRLAKHVQNDADTATQDHIRGASPTILSSLLRGTKVYVPPPPKKPEPVRASTNTPNPTHSSQRPQYRRNHTDSHQSPEYLASKARLLAAQEQAAYNRLLNPASTTSHDHQDPHAADNNAQLIAEDTLTPSLVINIFLSVLITGFSTYWALTMFTMPRILATTFSSWTGPRVDGGDTGGGATAAVKVLVSLFAALAVAVAESFLYAAYLGKVERARVKERRMKERKRVVGTVVDDGRVAGVEQTEEIEIWGKGVNGGVRRRVRERWEKGKEMGEGLS